MLSFFRRKKQKENTPDSAENPQKTGLIEAEDEMTSSPAHASEALETLDTEAAKSSTAETETKPLEEMGLDIEAEPKARQENLDNQENPDVISTQSKERSAKTETLVAEPTESKVLSDQEITLPKSAGFFTRLKNSLSKTRRSFTDSLANLVIGRKEIDADLLDELEMILLTADVGLDATDKIIQNLTDQVSRKELKEPEALISALKEQLRVLLEPVEKNLIIPKNHQGPYVILMVGVNGVGKTTTIGKLAKKFQNEGKSVMLAAGDTFRAAAVEQLETWGERNLVAVVAQKTGADSAAVIFDAIQSAKAKQVDVLIADTAGRLHTQTNLMDELKKVKRVIQKVDASAPHEVMLVLDAGTGQNAINQAAQFHQAMNLTGLTLTKLDGTAKGGVIFALADKLNIPVRFIGVGEAIDDLRPFDANDFSEALFDQS